MGWTSFLGSKSMIGIASVLLVVVGMFWGSYRQLKIGKIKRLDKEAILYSQELEQKNLEEINGEINKGVTIFFNEQEVL